MLYSIANFSSLKHGLHIRVRRLSAANWYISANRFPRVSISMDWFVIAENGGQEMPRKGEEAENPVIAGLSAYIVKATFKYY